MTDEQPGAEPKPNNAATPEGATPEGAATTEAAAGPEVRLMIHRHYVKDLSVENPNSPSIFTAREQPKVQVQLDVRANRVVERIFEAVLAVKVDAKVEDKAAFLVELEFAALCKIGDSVPDSEMETILAIEVPHLLFPFARNIVADVTRDSGFPPLLINPVDFTTLHRQKGPEPGQPTATGTA